MLLKAMLQWHVAAVEGVVPSECQTQLSRNAVCERQSGITPSKHLFAINCKLA